MTLALLISFYFMSACAKPILVRHGNLVSVSKQTVPEENSNASTLSIRWFGTANYYIRFGEVSILTDPFVSYQNLFRILFSGHIQSDPGLVKSMYGSLKPPEAIFIGHSHYDHMLDTVEALKFPRWNDIPVYGSETTKNILAGYTRRISPIELRDRKWSENWKEVEISGDWIGVCPVQGNQCEENPDTESITIFYKALEAEHAPHLPPNFKYFSGNVTKPLEKLPYRADDFKEGTTYVYLFKFVRGNGQNRVSYTIGFVGAAINMKMDLEGVDENVDILILCVPGWQYVEDYPGKLIEAFKPRIIILSHYDDFFEPDRNKRPITFVPGTDFYKFLDRIQEDIKNTKAYERFQKILVPDVGTAIYFGGE